MRIKKNCSIEDVQARRTEGGGVSAGAGSRGQDTTQKFALLAGTTLSLKTCSFPPSPLQDPPPPPPPLCLCLSAVCVCVRACPRARALVHGCLCLRANMCEIAQTHACFLWPAPACMYSHLTPAALLRRPGTGLRHQGCGTGQAEGDASVVSTSPARTAAAPSNASATSATLKPQEQAGFPFPAPRHRPGSDRGEGAQEVKVVGSWKEPQKHREYTTKCRCPGVSCHGWKRRMAYILKIMLVLPPG